MLIVVSKVFVPRGFRAITIFPFILLRYKEDRNDARLINHERIHLRQQLELLIVPFYLWYSFEYFLKLVRYKDKNLAYRAISFEREAYDNENNFYYLKQRSFCSSFKYI
ncbi:MAG: hypothetical protein P8M54_09070 [Flavobacterium sp.]|nr:hypothetical protein [Flavobacterium sp.]MDG2432597.1 hypothetical protein [Flavobacterium sp.]